MKRIWDLCSFEMLRVFKKPQSYILMFAMPLLFTLLFGSLLGGGSSKPVIAWVDQDHSFLSVDYAKNIKENTMFRIKAVSASKAKELFSNKDVSGIITIEKGFQKELLDGGSPSVQFKHGPEFSSAVAVNQILNNRIDQMHVVVTGAKRGERLSGTQNWKSFYQSIDKELGASTASVNVQTISKNKNQLEMNNMSARSAGFSILFLMIVMVSVTGTILEAKRSGVWMRMMAVPSGRFQILAGYFLSFFLIGWVQFAVLMVSSSLLFGVSWGNLAAVFVLVSALLLSVIGLGLAIAGFAKTTEQQAALGNLIVASTCMLGGVYWPLDIVPKVMQKIADFVPQKWAMDGFTEVIARGGTIPDILMPVSILLGFAALFIIIGMSRIKYE
ncbi:MAG: ABC transporter permease [Tuberibacillus sp.]